ASPILCSTMPRRSGFLHTALKVSNAVARQYVANARREAVAAARVLREQEREARRQRTLDRLNHSRDGAQAAELLNIGIAEQIDELTSLLSACLATGGALDFATLKREPDISPFNPGKLSKKEPAPT